MNFTELLGSSFPTVQTEQIIRKLKLEDAPALFNYYSNEKRSYCRNSTIKEEGCLRQFECHSVTGECKDMLIYSLLNTEFSKKSIYVIW